MKIKVAEEVRADAVDAAGARGVQIRLLIHDAEGAPNFHMRQFIIAPGGHTPRHRHPWEHEVFVLSGSGSIVSAEGELPLGPGQCVYVAPEDDHQFRNTGDDDLKFLCLIPKPK
jgi:quercetin dioxygenase-like cupin family protein